MLAYLVQEGPSHKEKTLFYIMSQHQKYQTMYVEKKNMWKFYLRLSNTCIYNKIDNLCTVLNFLNCYADVIGTPIKHTVTKPLYVRSVEVQFHAPPDGGAPPIAEKSMASFKLFQWPLWVFLCLTEGYQQFCPQLYVSLIFLGRIRMPKALLYSQFRLWKSFCRPGCSV